MIDTAHLIRRVESVRSFAPWPELRDDIVALCREVELLRKERDSLKYKLDQRAWR